MYGKKYPSFLAPMFPPVPPTPRSTPICFFACASGVRGVVVVRGCCVDAKEKPRKDAGRGCYRGKRFKYTFLNLLFFSVASGLNIAIRNHRCTTL